GVGDQPERAHRRIHLFVPKGHGAPLFFFRRISRPARLRFLLGPALLARPQAGGFRLCRVGVKNQPRAVGASDGGAAAAAIDLGVFVAPDNALGERFVALAESKALASQKPQLARAPAAVAAQAAA